jgi:hypothetical protein
MKTKFYLLAFVIAFASCKSTKFDKNTPVSEQETVIIGQIKILNKEKDITKNSKIYFDENKSGVLSYKLKEDGFILMKVPKGSHFIKLIYTPYGSANLPVGYANIAVPDHSNIYYIGKIEIQMDGNLSKKFQGAIYDTSPRWEMEKKLLIKVENNLEEAKKIYEKEFGNNNKFVESLLTLEK